MKTRKILSLIILSALLLTIFATPVSAIGYDITVSKDYSYVTYKGEKYIRIDNNDIYSTSAPAIMGDVIFAAGDHDIERVDAFADEYAVELWVTYKQGGNASYYYINESILSDFMQLSENGGDEYRIELYYDTVTIQRYQLFGSAKTIPGYELNYYSVTGNILLDTFDKSITILSGYLINDSEGNFYYVDHFKSSNDHEIPLDMQKSITVWQITDQNTIKELMDASPQYFFPDNDNFDGDIDGDGLGVGIVLLVVLLGIVPLICAIISFCISFKCNKEYKKRMRIISALCLLTLLITVITVIVCIAIAV